MARKLTLISELAGQTTHDITRDVDGWKRYLTTAARLYKYRFDEQLLIFAQRPDATACAEMETWNEKMRRWVKPGSKGIALIRQDGYGKPRLEYVFDVADTRPVRGAKMPYLWEMREEHHAPVLAALETRYGETEGADVGDRLMELAARAVREVYREHLSDLAYDTEGSFLEGLDELNLEVRYRDTLTASVQYALLSRCGLDPSGYLDDEDLQGITEFSTPAVLHHLGDAASTLSMGLLQEIGRTIRSFDRENLQNRQKNVQKPLAKAEDIGYTKGKEEFNTLKRESTERSTKNGGVDIQEERRLSDSRPDSGRGGRDGGNASGQVRDAAADLPSGETPRDVHLHAADGEAHAAPAGDRPAGAGTGRPDAGRDEEAGGRDGGIESPRSDGVGTGGEQPDGDGRGSGADGDRLQVTEQEAEETAGEDPAVFASEQSETGPFQLTLFPSVEEQIENIAQAQVEEQQEKGRAPAPTGAPVAEVPEAVIGRALTSGGNNPHSIERMVAFFQKTPTGSAAASFMEKEYGTGGKGLLIGGTEYALWFDREGIRIAPGKTTNVPGCTLVPWVKAGALAYRQLREGMFASQDKIDAARDNEYRELSEDLWYLRQDLSEEAEKQGFLPRLSELYGGFPESTEKIAELLKTTEGRADFGAELSAFAAAYENDRELLRFRLNHNPQALLRRISDLDIVPEPFKAKIDDFEPSRGNFITQDEIDHMLTRGGGVSEGNLRIYSYFMQGHDAKERAAFLRNEYGDGGFCYTGYDEWHDSKGIKLSRADDFSDNKNYDTVRLNWNQTQKRIGELIDTGRYLNPAERAYMPEYEKMQLARSIYTFYYCNPNDAERTYPHEWDFKAAERDIRPLLDDPEKSAALYADMVKVFAVLTPDDLNYSTMQKALDDMAAYQRGEYSLFTPLPEEALQGERQKKQAAKKAKSTPKKETEPAPVNELEAAARALARKSRVKTRERNDGQLTFDFAAMRVAEPEEPATPPKETIVVEVIRSPDLEREYQLKDAAREKAAQTLEQRGFVVSNELLDFAMAELDREAVDADAIVRHVEETLRRDEEETVLSQYDIGYGHMGNGLTVWNRLEEEHGDYKTIAHISPDRTVTFYDNGLPELIREQIQEIAATSEMTISATQDAPVFSTPARTEPVQEQERPATEPLTDLQKKAAEIAGRYEKLPLQEKIGIIAQAFGYTTGKIETSPCTGKWRGTSDMSIRFDNGVSLFIGNDLTPKAKTAKVQNECVNRAFVQYNPEIISVTKEAAAAALMKREAKDNEIAAQKGLKPYTLLNVEFNDGADEKSGGYIGWYYVTLAIDGKICAHMETGLNHDIANGKVSETPTRENYFAAGALKETEVDYVFNNVGFSSASSLYSLPIRDDVQERAEKTLAAREAAAPSTQEQANSAPAIGELKTISPADLYHEFLPKMQELFAGSVTYHYLQNNKPDRATGLEETRKQLDRLVGHLESGPFRAAYADFPLFAEWLASDIYDRAIRVWPEVRETGPDLVTLHAYDEDAPEWAHTGTKEPPDKSFSELYRETLTNLVDVVRGSSFYGYLRDRDTEYDEAKDELDSEIAYYMGDIAETQPVLYHAYTSLPMFREWLIEDILERTYQDYITDNRDAIAQHADDPDMPKWAREAQAVPTREQPVAKHSEPEAAPAKDNAPPLKKGREPSERSVTKLYRETLSSLIDMVRWDIRYHYLRDEDTDYGEAKKALNSDISNHIRGIAEKQPALYHAFTSLPMFREWLVEDILKFTYDVNNITDYRDAIAQHADDPDMPEWAREVKAAPVLEQTTPDNSEQKPAATEDNIPPPEAEAPEVTGTDAPEAQGQPEAPAKKPGRTLPELNYRAFMRMFPDIGNEKYTSMRLQAGESMMPLCVERIGDNEISIAHYFRQSGDSIADPEMTFRIDRERQALEPLTFEQPGLYQRVYPEPGQWIPRLRGDLNRFTAQWFRNIKEQEYLPERAVMEVDGERVEVTFDGTKPLMPEQAAQTSSSPAQSEEQNSTPEYRLLSRLHSDCDYFLGEGQRNEKHLWAGSVDAQIFKMRELYNAMPEKPEWLTEQDIENYEKQMTDLEPEAIGAGAPEAPEPSLTPNVGEYLNLKAQHPDKLIGVQVGGYYLFYGKDAEEAAPALGAKLLARDIPGLGETYVTGGTEAWQAQLKKLLEHGHSVVMARPDPEYPEGPYEIVRERDIADYIPIGMELTIDGQRMKIDSVNYETGRVSLMDMAMRGIYPIFRDEPVSFVREYVEEAQQKEFEDAARLDEMVNAATAAYEQSQREMEQAGAPNSGELEEAKGLIEEFLYNEFGNEEIDFPDLEHIGLAYTTTEDEQHEIQAEANLVDYSVSQFVDDVCVQKREYKSLRALIDAELAVLDFDDLVRLETPPETVREEEPPAELVEIDGGTVGRAVSGPSTPEIDGVKLHSIVIDLTGRTEPEPKAERRNFHITDDNLGTGGQKTKYQNNVAAIRTLREIEAEGHQTGSVRLATPEEQETLSKYVGWGGLAQAFDPNNEKWAKEHAELKELLTPEEYRSAQSTVLNAHYTSPAVIKAIYEAVGRMDFTPGNVLEPSCGIGNFFGLVPEKLADARLYGVELDSITGRIAKQLYQKADITVGGFETTDHPDDFFDLAVGNVPFGEYKVHDKRYDKQNLLIHDYFLTKTLDKVRPGGVVAFITTKGTMDKQNAKVRESLAQKADLLGAVRLPNNAFKANAGTEVTCDILFFQKRGSAPEKLPDWVRIGETEDGVPLNNYYLQHPEMVLGKMAHWQNMYGNATETACLPTEGADLSEQLSEAVQHIAQPDPELLHLDAPAQDEDGPGGEPIPADPNVRNFSFALSEGKIYFRENSRMKPVELGKTPTERVKGMIGIRDCARKLIDLQMGGAGDEEIKAEQARLNALYDRFRTKYGLLNDLGNSLAFRQDSSYPLLCSLEVLDDDGNLKRKADMFTKRTIAHHQAVTSVDTAAEALAVSIGEKACVDLGYMASLMGGGDKIPQIVKDLKGVIFKDPASGTFDIEEGGTNWYQGWQMADEYLSGDVRKKLAAARAAAEQNPEFAVNAEALEQVQPKDLTAAEISVRIGAPWIKPEYYRQFMFELMQTPYHLQHGKMDVLYSDVTGEWNVKGKGEDSDTNARVWNTYGTKRINAYGIFEDSLNQRNVQVFDTIYEDGREKRVLNGKETAIAQQKQELMAEAFRDWIFKDPERRTDLRKTYNTIFNSTRPREFNGEHISFVGMNPEIALRPHQRNAVARMLYGGNTLLAHCVGAGKTYTMTAAAMEAKRLGLSQKSLFVVPNHLTEQWGGDFLTLYPGAKVLVATKKDFKPRNRKKFCARIATGDYDAVVIGHSQFEKIPISPARQEAVIQEQIDEIVEAIAEAKRNNEERFTIKQMEKTRKNLEAKIQKLYDKKKDDTVTFEELGIDRLFVDEAHYYKNLYMHTKMRNVGGISQTEAQKSSDMFAKCRYLDEITGGRGVTFATGTPISNSMVELYTMMRYLQYSMLEERGLKHFDSWAADFGEKVTAVELKPEGTGFRTKTRFARFYNLPELINMWKEAADIQTADMLNLPTPEAEYITVQTEPSEAQKQMVQNLAERAEVVRRGRLDPRIDNMLKITSDGRKLALDQRIMNPLLADDPKSKVNACVGNVFQVWRDSADIKGTQLVFCDLSTPKGKADKTKTTGAKEDAEAGEDLDGVEDEEADRLESSVYEDIRKKLIDRGIPANEIAFIHDAKTDTQKAELFAKVRKGQVRVLLGSTAKMGAGTNVQDRIVATHDLDCPWRPADLEQRLGRSIRQGNMNEKVKVFRYVTKGTFDAYNWGLVESKQRFIGQVYTSKTPARSIEDVDATALSYAEVKMLATGDERIKEKMDLDIQVSKLKMLKANHNSQKFDMEDKVRGYYPQKIQETQLFIDCLTAELPILQSHPAKEDAFTMTVLGKVYTERKEAGEAIVKVCKSMKDPEKPIDLGEYRGFPMRLCFDGAKFKITMKQHLTHTAELSGDSVVGYIARINNALEKIPESLQNHKNRLVTLHKELESAKEEAARPFPQEDDLAVKSARLNELNAALDHVEAGGTQPEQDGAEEPVREDSAEPEQAGGKPSILKTLREYERPAPVPMGAQRGDRGEVL